MFRGFFRTSLFVGVAIFGISACGVEPAVDGSSEVAAEPLVEVVATGANIAGANGMAFGPDGNLYVASVLGSNMSVLNPESGEVIKVYGQS